MDLLFLRKNLPPVVLTFLGLLCLRAEIELLKNATPQAFTAFLWMCALFIGVGVVLLGDWGWLEEILFPPRIQRPQTQEPSASKPPARPPPQFRVRVPQRPVMRIELVAPKGDSQRFVNVDELEGGTRTH